MYIRMLIHRRLGISSICSRYPMIHYYQVKFATVHELALGLTRF